MVATTRILAAAGIVGPVVFTILVGIQGMAHRDYSHLALPISALAAWPHGWLQSLNFLTLAVLMTGFAVAFHRGVRPNKSARIGPACFFVSAVGLALAGLFPWARIGNAFSVPRGHLVGAFMAFVGAGTGLLFMARRMVKDAEWSHLAMYVAVSGT